MTDYTKLIERLRNTPNWQRESYGDWKQGTVHYDRAPFEAADAIEALLDRLEKAEKDAARLDWLNLAGNRFAFHLSGTWYSRKDHGSPYRKHKNIRLAIDAAMEASK